ncbi:MAG: hypothetical protein L0Z50_33885 [Verrucomicrobiales bacterium]|nr:hypothetical protein [Verrucomicrobiales bacterium]
MGRTSGEIGNVATWLWALFVVAHLSICPSLCADESAVEPQEVLKQIQAWRKSFATIRIQWRSWHRKDFIDVNPGVDPDEALGRTDYSDYEFVWADWGAFREQLTVVKKGQAVFRTAMGTPGNRPWGADSKYGESVERWDHIQFFRPIPDRPLKSNIGFDGITGLWNSSGSWFGDILAQSPNLVWSDYEELNGQRCLVVKVKNGDREDAYWLDPAEQFLPRQYRVSGPTPRADGSSFVGHWNTWTVAEFQLLAGGIAFPARGNLLEGDRGPPGFTWVIDRVVLNESLPRSFFEAPKPEQGTRVIDYDRGEAYVIAPRNSGSPVPPPVAAEVDQNTKAVARPDSFPWSWLVVAAAVVLAGGIVLRWWQRRRET